MFKSDRLPGYVDKIVDDEIHDEPSIDYIARHLAACHRQNKTIIARVGIVYNACLRHYRGNAHALIITAKVETTDYLRFDAGSIFLAFFRFARFINRKKAGMDRSPEHLCVWNWIM